MAWDGSLYRKPDKIRGHVKTVSLEKRLQLKRAPSLIVPIYVRFFLGTENW